MENLARYIIYPEGHTRASFSQERMQYLDQEGKVVYTSKDGRTSKDFPCLEWLACARAYRTGESRWCSFKVISFRTHPAFGAGDFNKLFLVKFEKLVRLAGFPSGPYSVNPLSIASDSGDSVIGYLYTIRGLNFF
jgi:hypothetical protein